MRAFPHLLIEVIGASDDGGSLLHNKPFDYVMVRPERTDFRARHSLLSGDHSPLWGWGHNKLESFGFWGRKSRVKDVEVITAESAGFSEEKDESLQTAIPLIRAAASNRRSSSWQTRFDKRTSAAVCDKGRNQRE